MGLPDGELIRESLAAPESFREIFERHYGSVDSYCVRRIGTDGHDVSAATFMEAFRVRHRFSEDADDARPWLFGIATNLLRRHRRAEARRWRAYARMPIGPEEPFDVDDRLDAAAIGTALASALRDLPGRDRDAVLLLAWADLAYDEIAIALHVPTGTVKSRIARARARLRTNLAAQGVDVEPLAARKDER